MTNFKIMKKKVIINNDKIQKFIIINYYIKDNFYKFRDINYNFHDFVK